MGPAIPISPEESVHEFVLLILVTSRLEVVLPIVNVAVVVVALL